MFKSICLCVATVLFAASIGLAEEAKAAPTTQPGSMVMTPEQMQLMEKLGTPSEGHELLKKMVGDWKGDVTAMMPGMPEQKTTGVMHNELVLGGRYIQSKFDGVSDGKPFQGIGYFGYDNYKKKYFNTWIDTMSTAMMTSEGPIDSAGKVINMSCEFECPMLGGQKVTARNVTTLVNDDKHTYEMYMPGPDGKEMKMMTIVYTRIKK